MENNKNQLVSSRSVGMRDINASFPSPLVGEGARRAGEGCRSGFTLIEILVVVLIIGVLSAIAVPQYKKVVEKSRATQAMTLLKSLGEAQEVYYLTHGEYATSFDKLEVQFPKEFQPGGTFFTYKTTDNHTNGEWVLTMVIEPGVVGAMYMGHPQGHPYAGAGFLYMPNIVRQNARNVIGLSCVEITNWGPVFKGKAGGYCQKLFSAGEDLCKCGSVREYKMATK